MKRKKTWDTYIADSKQTNNLRMHNRWLTCCNKNTQRWIRMSWQRAIMSDEPAKNDWNFNHGHQRYAWIWKYYFQLPPTASNQMQIQYCVIVAIRDSKDSWLYYYRQLQGLRWKRYLHIKFSLDPFGKYKVKGTHAGSVSSSIVFTVEAPQTFRSHIMTTSNANWKGTRIRQFKTIWVAVSCRTALNKFWNWTGRVSAKTFETTTRQTQAKNEDKKCINKAWMSIYKNKIISAIKSLTSLIFCGNGAGELFFYIMWLYKTKSL